MARLRLTVRHGAQVGRERFESLDQALVALERAADEVRFEGRLPAIKTLRDYEPGDRVAARLEISSGRMLGGRTAGIDVMGNGELVAFRGGLTREPLQRRDGESPFDAVRRTLDA